MEVVAEPHVGRRGLRRDRLQRRVWLDRRHDGGPPVVRHTEHADPAVVVRHVLQQPFDGVVGVGALVEAGGVARSAGRPLHHERAFGAELAADVLEHEDVAFVRQRLVVAHEAAVRALDAIGRAPQDDRQRPRLVLRCEDLGVETDAVARRNHHVLHGERVAGTLWGLRLDRGQCKAQQQGHGGNRETGRANGRRETGGHDCRTA